MHQALYRKWRPQMFDDVYGQDHITSILKYETQNHKFSHAYLFCGSRGTGKTTCAKILAKAVNCESPVNGNPCNKCAACVAIDSGAATDILEMDAASNNGVENIRDIRDEVIYTPSTLRYRVYIVDEVHMLSGSAFNALLKTLEEPPAHVVFILATTELHKLPSTIISRCQRFDFRRISTDTLVERLSYIAEQEGIEADNEAMRIIAKLAQGGMRDAISLLELCAGNHTRITEEIVESTVGSGGKDKIVKAVSAVAAADYDTIFEIVDEIVRSSKDISVFWQDVISYYRDMLVMKTTRTADRYLDLTDSERAVLVKTSELFTKETLLAHCRMLDDALFSMQRSGSVKRIVAEMTLIKMSDKTLDTGLDNILSRISKLETAVAFSAVSVNAAANEENKEVQAQKKATKPAKTADPQKAEQSPKAPSADIKKADLLPGKKTPMSNDGAKQVKGWNDIAERATVGNEYLRSFLKMARGYVTPDKKMIVRFPTRFAMDMIDGANVKGLLASIVALELQIVISDRDVIYEVSEVSDTDREDDLGAFEI